jgi:hypothetical protein
MALTEQVLPSPSRGLFFTKTGCSNNSLLNSRNWWYVPLLIKVVKSVEEVLIKILYVKFTEKVYVPLSESGVGTVHKFRLSTVDMRHE